MSAKRSFRYRVVDVFTSQPLEGNPLAVFPDAVGLDDATMQKIARELNLSETVFVSPPTRSDCAARVRIFTPSLELPFAGHPTIGTAFVLMDEGIIANDIEHFALQENVGPVAVRVDLAENGKPPLIWLRTPPIMDGETFDAGVCAQALGVDEGDLLGFSPQLLNAGNPTLFVPFKYKEALDRAWLSPHGYAAIKGQRKEPFCAFAFAPTREGAYSRMFAPEYGIPEDPATGSSTGPLAAYMMRHGLLSGKDGARYISEQGCKMGRRSLLHIRVLGNKGVDGIEVGGHVAPLVAATMTL